MWSLVVFTGHGEFVWVPFTVTVPREVTLPLKMAGLVQHINV